ncbi:MAG TPA: ABC transporter ATP-binding protein [Acidobacteriota bacterium]|nr:ABC transporter ATP-binding protein [Acidobacteriota bacterium]
MDYAIVCRNLYKRYQEGNRIVDALNGLDLVVKAGECFGLLGPNGAGKTTTVEILEGLLPPTSGEVEILGCRWGTGQDQQLRERIGITLQETRFPERLKVWEILELFRSFYTHGMTTEQAIATVALEEKADAWVRDLSGGQRQRLAVATALIGEPELLFLDEPTTGLDPQARRRLWDVIRDLRERGRTVLITTHYMDEAEKLCDRVAVVDHGKVIAEGSPNQLISQLGGEHIIEFSLESNGANGIQPHDFLALPPVIRAAKEADGFLLTVAQPHVAIPAVLELVDRCNGKLNSLTTRHANLEDVFVSLTGRFLRDE